MATLHLRSFFAWSASLLSWWPILDASSGPKLVVGFPSSLGTILPPLVRSDIIPTRDLVDGHRIPLTGIGMCCRETARGDPATQSIVEYLELGGRHIDTAVLYQNHEEIGRGMQQWMQSKLDEPGGGAGVEQNQELVKNLRRQLFLTSKIWSDKFGYENTYRTVKKSLLELQTEYLDLVLLHVSGEQGFNGDKDPSCVDIASDGRPDWELCRHASWAALEVLKDEGFIRSIGVSNWDVPKIERLHRHSKHRVAVNQLELHPWYPQREMLDFANQQKIVLTAYGSMGSTRLSKQIVTQHVFQQLAEQVGRNITSGQILLRWAVQKGVVVIPGTANPKHMQENLDLFSFSLSDDQMAFLDSIADTNEAMHLYNHRPDLIL
ncbi:unnamed protein product [Amoebophrya sp. A120]|nr:unnamed protein product [Amoebophrya sp. A120]|eukprot:GSA120T00002112001.1